MAEAYIWTDDEMCYYGECVFVFMFLSTITRREG